MPCVRGWGRARPSCRPGLIVGPFDPTDRFAYWVARFLQPALLGDRPPEAVVPAPPERALQFIDARDLGEWLVGLAERDTAGTFNAASERGHFSWGGLVEALTAVARERGLAGPHGIPTPRWLDDATLTAHQVSPVDRAAALAARERGRPRGLPRVRLPARPRRRPRRTRARGHHPRHRRLARRAPQRPRLALSPHRRQRARDIGVRSNLGQRGVSRGETMTMGSLNRAVAMTAIVRLADPAECVLRRRTRPHSAVVGSMISRTADTLFAGKPPSLACSCTMASSGAI